MARRPRLTYPGAIHHVMSRGNRRSRIFIRDADRLDFLELLSAARERFGVRWRSYMIMNTHYHLEVETPEANISATMKYINGVFTQRWNRRHRTTGHVFEGRFKSPLIENGFYARSVLRYIALNPVEAHYVKHAAECDRFLGERDQLVGSGLGQRLDRFVSANVGRCAHDFSLPWDVRRDRRTGTASLTAPSRRTTLPSASGTA